MKSRVHKFAMHYSQSTGVAGYLGLFELCRGEEIMSGNVLLNFIHINKI